MSASIYTFISTYLWIIGIVFFILIAFYGTSKKQDELKSAKKKWKSVVKANMHEPLSLHPEIDPALCGACGACVTACPEGEILKIVNHRAVLVEATKCVGHGECQVACPYNAIELVFGTKTRGMDLPRVNTNYETNVKGLYIAGELGGMGLIRNAAKQGRLAAEHASKNLSTSARAEHDVLVVGCGPAGISASMACSGAGIKYLCLEQNNFGGTIYNFPRQKVVMSHPVEMPVVGKLKFSQNKVSKEELLHTWHGLRKKVKLNIKEGAKFVNLKKSNDFFEIETSKGPMTAQKVILAMGVRGTPRKLGCPGEDSAKVTYNLLDPEQYQKQYIAVVGGGNAGVEAAQYLAKREYQNRVYLLVRSDTFDRCNEENQNIIFDLEKKGRVKILFNTSVMEVHPRHLIIDHKGKPENIKNDFLFVFAGALLPFDFLKSIGIMIDKKFGEAI